MNLPFWVEPVIISHMATKPLTTVLFSLALLAMAVQGLGAENFADACQCLACDCGQSAKGMSCCANHEVPTATPVCARSCCQSSVADCSGVAPTLGSCCCRGAELPTPLNSPRSDKSSPEKPLPAIMPAPALVAVSLPQVCGQFEISTQFETPPPRILYCVWRN